ncbi:MAG: thiamine-phosphate pyrophosphorylase [candidate division FCPU426 bacterium]
MPDAWYRLLDANCNRAREGLRVVEDLARLVWEDADVQRRIKRLRHALREEEARVPLPARARSRAVERDPGARLTLRSEASRATWHDLAWANLRRSQEALRVLEEIAKLRPRVVDASRFKRLRFETYALEGQLVERWGRTQLPIGRRSGRKRKGKP